MAARKSNAKTTKTRSAKSRSEAATKAAATRRRNARKAEREAAAGVTVRDQHPVHPESVETTVLATPDTSEAPEASADFDEDKLSIKSRVAILEDAVRALATGNASNAQVIMDERL